MMAAMPGLARLGGHDYVTGIGFIPRCETVGVIGVPERVYMILVRRVEALAVKHGPRRGRRTKECTGEYRKQDNGYRMHKPGPHLV